MPHKSHYAKDLHEFAVRMELLEPGVLYMSNEYKKIVAQRVHERIVMETPVDTSQALSNWQIATATTGAVDNPIPAFVVGKGGSSEMASIIATRAAAAIVLQTAPIGYPISISNVVDYIGDLAYRDKSIQATGDWVGRAMIMGLRQGMIEANQKVVW